MSNLPSRIINMLGGPCSGKSTWRAGLFFHMKRAGLDCEEIIEWVKGPIYEGRHAIVAHQPYIFGKQLRDTDRVLGKVDVAITDSPVVQSAFYGRKFAPEFSDLLYQGMIEEFKRRGGCNIFLRRVGTYNPTGRLQTEAEADAVADELRDFLVANAISFTEFRADEDARIIKHALDFAKGTF